MTFLQSTRKAGPGTMRRYCPDCGVCFDTNSGSTERCETCGHAHNLEMKRMEAYNQPPRPDQRFRPQGPAVKDLVIIPGGLDGFDDAYLWQMEIPPLVKCDPSIAGLRALYCGKTVEILADGTLKEIKR